MLSDKDAKDIIVKNDKFTDDTLIALGVVKKYICENNLIIVGGMAIDLSLRLKGLKLYDDETIPDYDFYSPEYNKDAYKIAEKLNQLGLKNISVINANHISTMRVRVNYTVVADVTYIPINIYNTLPHLIYRGLRIIHPHYQMIDQHRALTYPYENAPYEVIKHRWKKDATRYDMLYTYYPLRPKDFKETGEIEFMGEIKISNIIFKNQCIGGFAGLMYWEAYAKKLGYSGGGVKLGSISEDVNGFVIKIPIDSHGISIYSNDIMGLYNNLDKKFDIKKKRQYNRFLDKLPYKIILDNKWELFDNSGSMLGAYKTKGDIYIANLQAVMLYMLTNLILLQKIKDVERGYTFYLGYIKAQSLVMWAGDLYKKNTNKNYCPLLPSVDVYGSEEISDSYINSKRIFLEKLHMRDPCIFQPDIIFPDTFVGGLIPKKYYNFKPYKSPILNFDGCESSVYKKRIYL